MRRSLFFLLSCLVAASCDDSTGPETLVGTWRLETVSGQSLPYVLEEGGGRKVELTGETVTLLASGKQTMVTSFRVTEAGNVFLESIPAPGSYTVNGSIVLLAFDEDDATYTALIDGRTMTIDDIGLRFVYRRD